MYSQSPIQKFGDDESAPSQVDNVLRTLTTLIPCPPHQPNVICVARSAAACITAAIAITPEFHVLASPFVAQLQEFVDGLQAAGHGGTSDATLIGLASTYREWCCLAKLDTTSEQFVEVMQLLGLEICVALARKKTIRGSNFSLASRWIRDAATGVKPHQQKDAQEVPKAIARLSKLTHSLAPCLNAGKDASEHVNLNMLAMSAISASLSSLRAKERQAAGAHSALSLSDARIALDGLRQLSEKGDSDALAIQIAFCTGLPWHIATLIPFSSGQRPKGAMAWIHVQLGLIIVDLKPALPDIPAQGTERHVASTFLLSRPLPLTTANQLMEAVSTNPHLKVVGDLVMRGKFGKSKLGLQGLHHSASVARLISAAGQIALQGCNRRDLAGISTLSFELLNKSDLHYFTTKSSDVWSVCTMLFSMVGLGDPVPMPSHLEFQRVGSNLSPQMQWVAEVFEEATVALANSRAGRRYTVASVVNHHNAFARYVGLMLQLCLGGRDRKTLNFTAELVSDHNAFALLVEHKLSKTMGETPLPIPACLSKQIALWKCHLIALARRLAKLKAPGTDKAQLWINQILAGKDVPLVFTLAPEASPLPMRKALWQQGKAADLNSDFGRHLVPDALTGRGLPFCDAQDWLRHDTNGISHNVVSSEHVKYLYLQRTATALNSVLLALRIHPLSGLTKEPA
jgi:hypothetical protein